MKNTYYCIGIMSGTSLDGVDLVYATLTSDENYSYQILKTKTYAYSQEWLVALKEAFHKKPVDLIELDVRYGKYTGELAKQFIIENSIEQIDFIASHGHTIFHKPEMGYTLQIGSGKEIANITQCKTICDFRTQDVKFGGQGAPLVPVGDSLLFSDFDYCLNLGGFANVSYQRCSERLAYDICPVNIVLNYYVQQYDLSFDEGGQIAKSGKVHESLLKALNANSFYQQKPPKSLGFEFVSQQIIPLIDSFDLALKDILRTFVEHVAMQISAVVNRKEKSKTLITGGGAYNSFLIERLEALSITEISIPAKDLVEFKEALIFGLLGLLKIEEKVNCLKSVTGASKDHSSGAIYYPN